MILRSSYRLKTGDRQGRNEPDGKYDGTFLADYEYLEGSRMLYKYNGRMTIIQEFDHSTYAYFLTAEGGQPQAPPLQCRERLTSDFPNIPRCFQNKPSQDFAKGGFRR